MIYIGFSLIQFLDHIKTAKSKVILFREIFIQDNLTFFVFVKMFKWKKWNTINNIIEKVKKKQFFQI